MNDSQESKIPETDIDEAVAAHLQALKDGAPGDGVFHAIVLLYKKAGRVREAEDYYHRAIEINPNHAKAHNNLGNILLETRRHTEAIEAYEKAIEIDPNYALAHKNVANAYFQVGFRDKAIDTYEKAIELDPDLGGAYFNLSQIYYFEKRFARAVKYYDQAVENGYNQIPEYRDELRRKMEDRA